MLSEKLVRVRSVLTHIQDEPARTNLLNIMDLCIDDALALERSAVSDLARIGDDLPDNVVRGNFSRRIPIVNFSHPPCDGGAA